MDTLDEIKILLKLREGINQMNQVKPGWQCSEFWLTLMTNLIGVLGMAKGVVPPQYQGYVAVALVVLNGVYTTARTLVKNQASTTTTTVTGPAIVTTTPTKP
jgi:hypothetical protein